jgi:dienelactone hydrolase
MGVWRLVFLLGLIPVELGVRDLDLQQPPAQRPAEMPPLSSLLPNDEEAAGRRVAITAANWGKQRARFQQQWQEVLGDFPKIRVPLQAEVLATERLAGFSRSLVKYQVEGGVFTDGYLLRPEPASRRGPAVVVFHPTTPLQAKSVAGVEPGYDQEKQQGIQLVKRGFVVWCPRNYINDEGADWAGNARRVLCVHPNWTGLTRMVWDAIRAVDYLETLPEVDRSRIGCIGHSLGAKVALYAMAFDGRYRAGVASEGGIGLKFSNWDAPWYLGAKIREPNFKLENHEILALIAPRAFLLLAGDSADGDRSWVFIESVLPVYTALGAPKNLGWMNHHLGHRYAPSARAVAEEFLARHLGL